MHDAQCPIPTTGDIMRASKQNQHYHTCPRWHLLWPGISNQITVTLDAKVAHAIITWIKNWLGRYFGNCKCRTICLHFILLFFFPLLDLVWRHVFFVVFLFPLWYIWRRWMSGERSHDFSLICAFPGAASWLISATFDPIEQRSCIILSYGLVMLM